MDPRHEPLSDAQIERLRADTPGAGSVVHLNHAGSSLPPNTVLDAHIDHLRAEAQMGGYEAAAAAADRITAVYGDLATLVGGSVGEIARFEHATAAWNALFWSLPMRPGQAVLTNEVVYGSDLVGMLLAAQRRGVEVVIVPSGADGRIDLDELERLLDGDVAAVCATHVPTNGGVVNPVAEIGARTRAAGVPYLLDACQSVGQLEIDVAAIGCDLLSTTGRKYLRGPRGTGLAPRSSSGWSRTSRTSSAPSCNRPAPSSTAPMPAGSSTGSTPTPHGSDSARRPGSPTTSVGRRSRPRCDGRVRPCGADSAGSASPCTTSGPTRAGS